MIETVFILLFTIAAILANLWARETYPVILGYTKHKKPREIWGKRDYIAEPSYNCNVKYRDVSGFVILVTPAAILLTALIFTLI